MRDVSNAIDSAFDERPEPTRYTITGVDEDGDEYNEEFFRLAKVGFAPDEVVKLPWDAISYLNNNGFLFFLPKLLIATIESDTYYVDRTMVALIAKKDLLERELSIREKSAVIDILEEIKIVRKEEIEENLDDEAIDEFLECLKEQ